MTKQNKNAIMALLRLSREIFHVILIFYFVNKRKSQSFDLQNFDFKVSELEKFSNLSKIVI
jgi:hypothetical protein